MTDIAIAEAALSSAVKATLAVEMLHDLVDVDSELVEEEARRGCLMPEDVFVLHLRAQMDGKPVRTVAELVRDIDARLTPAIEGMRMQLRCHAVDDAHFDAAVRRALVGRAS
jgi:hypothetical protein